LYGEPLRIERSARLQAVRFVPGGASRPAVAEFRRRGPKPPRPDIRLGDLTALKATVGWGDRPRVDRSIGDNPLRLGGTLYEHGMGVNANSELEYALKPEYERFVAVIGVDDAMRTYRQGTVVFEIRIDDRAVFDTFVMRPGDYTYVDLPIPPGSRKIRLLALSTRDGTVCDHGDWAEAGFIVKTKK
jgi:endo-alpha-N-acetylgalactosaminidase